MSSEVFKELMRRKKVVEFWSKCERDMTAANRMDAIPEKIKHLPEKVLRAVNHQKLLLQVDHFQCPEWAGNCEPGCHLEVRKTGAKLPHIMIDRHAYTMFGQDKEIVDVRVEHQSISRIHCCIIHRAADDHWYLVDLDSTNGVFLQGKRIPPQKFTRIEYDQTFKMGASTRLYTLRKKAPPPRSSKVFDTKGPNDRIKDDKDSAAEKKEQKAAAKASDTEKLAAVVPDKYAQMIQEEEKLPPRRLKHILIKHVESNNPVSKNPSRKGEAITRTPEEAKALAADIFSMGPDLIPDWDAVVTEFSDCSTAKKGGDMGMVEKGKFMQEFDRVAFALLPGQFSAPISTPLGIHIILRPEDPPAAPQAEPPVPPPAASEEVPQ